MRFVSLALMMTAAATAGAAPAQVGDPGVRAMQPGPDQATQGDFGTLQISTTDPEQLHKDWAQPTEGVRIATQDQATRNQPIFSFIVFRACKAGADGNCHVSVRFETLDPRGKPYDAGGEAPIWDLPPPPSGRLQLSEGGLGLRIEDGEALGQYRVIARTTDHVAGITLTTEGTLTIVEAPRAGGWSAVANPAGDPDIRAAAQAMLAKLPAGHAGLDTIVTAQRQVVAGTNYRLILRLTDGDKWTALVWHKLDGSFVVSDPSRVQ
ncbi:hypothetical protein QH494_22830 [Sphingomonas sp. AR_OL41]|uniref:hypothetical protein n=1 Tax=Sphingomonas sp. AR_OL41 TaxID=3042729 RepID=UPI002481426A|nr:hypothetical protein [Sphingomonas sp. AR_OL41]MDH7975028.1 hypothetical protein [Sphingomonas sp. AR_OL41]